MEVLRSEDWSSISYCCGWGRRVSRGPNPLLQAQLRGLRMVPVPWLTSSKLAQMSWSPSIHPPITNTHTLKYPLFSNSLLTPQPKQSTQVTFLITRALSRSLNWYLWYLISSAVHLSFSFLVPLSSLWSWEGSLPVSAVLWHRAWSDFWMTLAWKWAYHSQYSAALCLQGVFK